MAITDHFRENAYKHVPIKSSGVLFTYFISEVIKHLDGKQIIILSAPWGATVNICKTLPPSRQNRAGNDENTHVNNYTKHSFNKFNWGNTRRSDRLKVQNSNIHQEICRLPVRVRESYINHANRLGQNLSQGLSWEMDGGMPGKNSRVQHYKYVLFEEGLLSVLGEKFGKKILTDC